MTTNYFAWDGQITAQCKEGVNLPSGFSTGNYPVTQFSQVGFSNAQQSNILSQITQYGVTAGRVVPYAISPNAPQNVWQLTVLANSSRYVRLATDLASDFGFSPFDINLIINNGDTYVQLDVCRTLSILSTLTAGELTARICGTDFWGRKTVSDISDVTVNTSNAFSTVSSIMLTNNSGTDVQVEINTNTVYGLPYQDTNSSRFLGLIFQNQPVLQCEYAKIIYDNGFLNPGQNLDDNPQDPLNTFLPTFGVDEITQVPGNNQYLIFRQAVYDVGYVSPTQDPKDFNYDLAYNMENVIGSTPLAINWIGWRG